MELALVAPVVMALLLAAVDLGRVFYAKITITNAAREGAFVAAQHPSSYVPGAACSDTNLVVCAATREASGSDVTILPSNVSLVCTPSCVPTYGVEVDVTVVGAFEPITPFIKALIGAEHVTLTATASADVIRTPGVATTPLPSASPAPTPPASPAPSPSAGPTSTPIASPTATPPPTAEPTCGPPVAGFTYTQARKNDPVVFTSTSAPTSGPCAINYWRWDYGDGSTDAGNLSTTTHAYGPQHRGETFTVSLSVTTPGGVITVTRSVTTLP